MVSRSFQPPNAGRSPRGECGLKSEDFAGLYSAEESLPSRGVWIEMISRRISRSGSSSLPSRGVWIEMLSNASMSSWRIVAPLAGSVD